MRNKKQPFSLSGYHQVTKIHDRWCVASHSLMAASRRVCHPGPEARKLVTTSRDRRMVTRSLVAMARGRPTLFSLRNSVSVSS